MAIAEVV